jgi:hypothetical protein
MGECPINNGCHIKQVFAESRAVISIYSQLWLIITVVILLLPFERKDYCMYMQ